MSNTEKLIQECRERGILCLETGTVVDHILFDFLHSALMDVLYEDVLWYGNFAKKEVEKWQNVQFDTCVTL